MRKKKHPEHVNHERWLVSYADFITLLFAFFVVMFSVSRVDTKQVGRFTESFASAVGIVPLGGGQGRGVLPGALAPTPLTQGTEEAPKSEIGDVEAKLRGESGADKMEGVSILRYGNELVIRFAEAASFASGDAELKAPAVRALLAIADVLRERRVALRVEGHTDDIPIANARFRSNWELSTSRATAVVAELLGRGRMDPRRLAAAGYAEFHPVAPNGSAEQRALNRRVDIVITEIRAAVAVPAPPPEQAPTHEPAAH